MTSAGAVLDQAGIPIPTATGDQRAPGVASDGSAWLVVWQDDRDAATGYDIYGARVTGAGAVQDAAGIHVSASPADEADPSVAWNGANYLVAWTDPRNASTTGEDIYGARISPAGAVLEPGGIALSTAPDAQSAPAVASDGSGWLVVWQDPRNVATNGTDVYGARVTGAGAVQAIPRPAHLHGTPGPDGPGGRLGRGRATSWSGRTTGTAGSPAATSTVSA